MLAVIVALTAPALAADPLVDVRSLVPDAVLDVRYATDANFLGRALYPRAAAFLRRSTAARLARAAGNRRAQNMVCVGAASPLLDFEEDRLLAFVEMLFARKGGKIVTVNQHAFRLGRAAGLFFRGLAEAGVPKRAALDLVNKFDPDTIDPALVADWACFVGDACDGLPHLGQVKAGARERVLRRVFRARDARDVAAQPRQVQRSCEEVDGAQPQRLDRGADGSSRGDVRT